ncbi:MAG: cytochrome c3 family protein, partial [Pirellulales bacterium]
MLSALAYFGRPRSIVIGLAVLGAALAAAALLALWPVRGPKADAELARSLPRRVKNDEFVSSAACRSCHPNEYASWHASYHRQMTQPATPDAVKASFHDEVFPVGENAVRLRRRDDEFWVELLGSCEPDGRTRPKLRETRVVMTTGSHHMQQFWVARGGAGNLLDHLPLMWLVGDAERAGRWIPIGDSVLAPPGEDDATPWNASCIFCHSVNGNPRLDRKAMTADSEVAELGIACEACHGGGKKHIEAHRQRRAAEAANTASQKAPDETIVQPGRLDKVRSAEVCGHCHAVAGFASDSIGEEWYRSGDRFRPGDDLTQFRLTLSPSRLTPERLAALRKDNAAIWEGNFWPDGMVRVTGREYNGLIESACYARGDMTCLACHSLHQSDPNDQLAARMETNEACYQCHAGFRQTLERHTHHVADSSGSQCYNCHMPHTTYGLFKAIRSHQITSPNVATTLDTGRPNACNLCHLDRRISWTAETLTAWYGQPAVEIAEDQLSASAGVLWLLRGDAVQRALVAWAFGWPAARRASGEGWQAPLLAALL